MNEEENKTNENVQVIEKEITDQEVEAESEKIDEQKEIETEEKKYNNYEKALEKQPEKKKKTIMIVSIVAVIILILLMASTIFALLNIKNHNIIQGVTIGKIDMSNKSKEEAKVALEEIYNKKHDNEICMKYGEYETTITYSTLEVQFGIDEAIEKAYRIGRNQNIFVNNFEIIKSLINETNIEVKTSINTEMIEQIAQNINNNLEGAVVQSSYYIEDETLIITKGKKGIAVDQSKFLSMIYEVLKEDTEAEQKIEIPVKEVEPEDINIEKIYEEVHKEPQDAYYTQNPFTIHAEVQGIDFDLEAAKILLQEQKEEYEIELTITNPSITVKQFGTEAFPNLLGTCSTKYDAGNTNRTTNLRLAAGKIDGVVLLPGETFSYNKTVGERTIAAGYKDAKIYSNGQVIDGLGGGICQISSTLYDAVVFANLKVTVRRNHQFVTSYLPAGKDATVVWGSQDFQFVNTRANPIKIVASVSGGTATISIYGLKEENEYDISIQTKTTATIPYTTKYIEDSSLPAGQEKVIQNGANGRKVEAYKIMKQDGKVVSTTILSKDTYNAMQRIVKVGTKSSEPQPTEPTTSNDQEITNVPETPSSSDETSEQTSGDVTVTVE